MVCIEEHGVSDIVAIAFMFILLVFSATLLFGFIPGGLEEAAERQTRVKASHLHRTLEKTEVLPGITALDAAAKQLVVENAPVENDYLRSWMDNALEFLRPADYGVELTLRRGDQRWSVVQPENVERGESFLRRGSVSLTKTGGIVTTVNLEIKVFRISD